MLYATDLVISDDNFEQQMAFIEKEWKADWKYFATNEPMDSPNVDASFTGLGLDKEILKKIYYANAVKWYPGIFE